MESFIVGDDTDFKSSQSFSKCVYVYGFLQHHKTRKKCPCYDICHIAF